MSFKIRFDENLECEQLYRLQDEMAKYKTLAHSEISWDFVRDCSLEILENNSLDSKILHYFIIALITLNQKDLFNNLPHIFDAFLELHNNHTWEKQSTQNSQKKFLKNSLSLLIESNNNKSIAIPSNLIEKLQNQIDEFGKILDFNFKKLQKVEPKLTAAKPSQSATHTTYQHSTKNSDINSLNDREYREYFLSLSKSLLSQNLSNPNISGIFIQACYGRILTLPQHKEAITNIPYPQANTINMLENLSKNPPSVEVFSTFMENLALNPYYFMGQKIFIEYLKSHDFLATAESLAYLVNNFLHSHNEIFALKFSSGEAFCDSETKQFFANFNKISDYAESNLVESSTDSTSKTIENALKDIESSHKDSSLKSKLHALIDIADTFHNNNLHASATNLYQQILNIIDTSELREYLSDEYARIKNMVE